jgi:quinol monooxygenase YgiN
VKLTKHLKTSAKILRKIKLIKVSLLRNVAKFVEIWRNEIKVSRHFSLKHYVTTHFCTPELPLKGQQILLQGVDQMVNGMVQAR